MSGPPLRDRLSDVDVPRGDAARERAWTAVEGAFAERRPPRGSLAIGRRAPGALAGVALLVLLLAVAAGATQPGSAVRGLVVRVLGGDAPPAPRRHLGPLPAGRLLVTSPRGAFVVARDGSRRLLGPYAGASWSPHGLYVVAWRGADVRAVAPDGRVAWTLRTIATVADARWSPDGFRIAYRRAGGLGLVAGDGTGARPLAARVAPAAPAWRPGAPHTLAWVDAGGFAVVRDVDTGAVAWRSPVPLGRGARELLWSADGRLLLIRGARRLVVADLPANRVRRMRVAAGERVVAAAWAPRGRRLAVVVRRVSRDLSRVLVVAAPRRDALLRARAVFATTGSLASPAWSPDGRRVLVRWSDADEWLLLPPHRAPVGAAAAAPGADPIVAIAPISRRFGGVPVVRGWCCTG
jgi:hypothetical protein